MKIKKSILISYTCPVCSTTLELPEENIQTFPTQPNILVKKQRKSRPINQYCPLCDKYFRSIKAHNRTFHNPLGKQHMQKIAMLGREALTKLQQQII
jgi:hypothetical protein